MDEKQAIVLSWWDMMKQFQALLKSGEYIELLAQQRDEISA